MPRLEDENTERARIVCGPGALEDTGNTRRNGALRLGCGGEKIVLGLAGGFGV